LVPEMAIEKKRNLRVLIGVIVDIEWD